MSKKATEKGKTRSRGDLTDETTRLCLMFPAKLVARPVVYELGQKFQVVTNVREASVHDDIGMLSLELSGPQKELDKALRWLERIGVKVEIADSDVGDHRE